MARPKEVGTMFAYSLHARTNRETLNYPAFFRTMAQFAGPRRQTSVGNEPEPPSRTWRK